MDVHRYVPVPPAVQDPPVCRIPIGCKSYLQWTRHGQMNSNKGKLAQNDIANENSFFCDTYVVCESQYNVISI